MDRQAFRASLLEDFRQKEARLRKLEIAYLECKHANGSDAECLDAYKAVRAAAKAADDAYERYLASDQDFDR